MAYEATVRWLGVYKGYRGLVASDVFPYKVVWEGRTRDTRAAALKDATYKLREWLPGPYKNPQPRDPRTGRFRKRRR